MSENEFDLKTEERTANTMEILNESNKYIK